MNERREPGLTKGEKSRQKIIAKAAAIFNQRGYEGSSMQDIVEAVGLEKGSIYGHFSSKEELALEAYDFAWDDTVQKRMKNLDRVSNAVDKLKLHIGNYVDTPSFSGGCPWLNTAVEADDGNLALRDRARKSVRVWADALAGIVAQGQELGEIQPQVEPLSVAAFVISTLEGAIAVHRIDKRSDALRYAQENLNLFLETTVRLQS